MIDPKTSGLFSPAFVRWIFDHSFFCPCDGFWECPDGEDGYLVGLA